MPTPASGSLPFWRTYSWRCGDKARGRFRCSRHGQSIHRNAEAGMQRFSPLLAIRLSVHFLVSGDCAGSSRHRGRQALVTAWLPSRGKTMDIPVPRPALGPLEIFAHLHHCLLRYIPLIQHVLQQGHRLVHLLLRHDVSLHVPPFQQRRSNNFAQSQSKPATDFFQWPESQFSNPFF